MISAKPPNLNYLSKSSICYHILASFLDPFGFKFQYHFTLICWCLFKLYFFDFWLKRVQKLGPQKLMVAASQLRFLINFASIWSPCRFLFHDSWCRFRHLVGAFLGSWCWLTVPRRFQNPILSIWICRSPLGAAVAPRAYNDLWHPFSWPPKSRNLQQV